jgi:hypothetical protein
MSKILKKAAKLEDKFGRFVDAESLSTDAVTLRRLEYFEKQIKEISEMLKEDS